jgi:hypothetical protein
MKKIALLLAVVFTGPEFSAQNNTFSYVVPEIRDSIHQPEDTNEPINITFVSICPNPFMSKAMISLPAGYSEDHSRILFELTDVLGNVVLSKTIHSEHTEVDRGRLAPGGYFYQLTSDGKILASGKLVAQ